MDALKSTHISDTLKESASVLLKLSEDPHILDTICTLAKVCVTALESGNKILFMGNGGSAADSQHLAAELVSRFEFDRPGLSAIALTTDTSAITAIGNDYGYERLFLRQIEAIGRTGDVLLGFSTSGESENIMLGFQAAKAMGISSAGLTGNKKGSITKHVDYLIEVPSANTARIQEGHIAIGHTICGLIEQQMFGAK